MSELSEDEIASLAKRFEKEEPQAILKWSLERFHPRVALASSFGAEDTVLIDMLCKIYPKPRIFTLDTGRLHQETYNLMDGIRERYGIEIEVYFPQADSVKKMVREHGLNLFYKSVELRMLCCNVRKVEPLSRALSELDVWITGLRREQSPARAIINKVEIDTVNGSIVKINPLADWSNDQVWSYIRENNVPYNRLYNEGYASIGCVPCTRPIKPCEDLRAGRWWWEQNSAKECGLHYRLEKGKFILKTKD
ncbi:MAG: phosphoadenylyl-sulfate reductase [Nitrososphaerales archaeon]